MRLPLLPIALASLSLLLAACQREANVNDLKSAFEKPDDGGVSASANPEAKAAMERAVSAIQSGDQITAVGSLDQLRRRPDLGPDQAIKVQQMMSRVQTEIAERAAAGDPQAKAQLEMIRAGNYRQPR